jgi:HlyD family secretion protein
MKAAQQALDDAKERLSETSVYSPIDGTVVARHVQVGEVVQSGKTSLTGGTILLEIADVNAVYAEVDVDEADIGLVRQLVSPTGGAADTRPVELPEGVIDTSQEVEVTVEAYPDQEFTGVIERISPQSEVIRAIATFKVWIRIVSDNAGRLKHVLNSQAQAKFTAKSVKDAILVDYEAMKAAPNGDGYGVYIPVEQPEPNEDPYEFVACSFGVDNRVQVEVLEGLEEGQKVYTELPRKTHAEQKEEEEAMND